ncbi:MAG: sigma-70 family RNA polymerase sigma factor [Planctomycetota bacterium]
MQPDHDLDALSLPDSWAQSHAAFQRLARAVIGDAALAEDAVQGAYVSALRAPGRARSARWWTRAVRSRAIDGIRRRRNDTGDPSVRRVEPSTPATDEIAARLELHRTVVRSVEELDEPYRETVYLRFFEDSTPTEIAARLDVPVKTVKTRLTRGLARLRERLGARFEDGDWRRQLTAIALLPRPRGTTGSIESAESALAALETHSLLIGAAGALTGMKKIALVVTLAAVAALAWKVVPPRVERVAGPEVAARSDAPADLALVAAEDDLAEPSEASAPTRSSVDAPDAGPASTISESAPESGRLRVHVSWPEGDDAAGVGVLIRTSEASGFDVRAGALVVTDADGVAFADDLPTGRVEVGGFRSAHESLARGEIRAGATTELSCTLLDGVLVRGKVVDAEGSPIPHAQVWLTSRAPSLYGGRVAARADADGRFELRHVPPTQSIGAFADGYAPSELQDLDLVDLSSPPVELRIELVPAGAALRGRVVTGDEQPVAGARVALRSPFPETRIEHIGGRMSERWTPRVAITDQAGQYSFTGLLPGTTKVEVLADAFPLWKGEVELERRATGEMDVVLEPGATIRGVLRDAANEPVPGGRVVAYESAIQERFLPLGQLPGTGAIFGREIARTDDAGAFVLGPLPTGEAHVYAQPPRNESQQLGAAMLWDSTKLDLAPGDDVTWDPRLDRGLVIEGRVCYSDGSSMPGVFVAAKVDSTGKEFATFSEDGTFEFIRLANERHTVRVQLQSAPPGAAPIVATDVLPGGAALELRADFENPDEVQPARITVRIDDSAGRAGSERIWMHLEDLTERDWHRGRGDGDRWTFEQRYPGRFRVVALAGERLIASTEAFDVVPGQDLDLGTLATEPGGALAVTVRRGEGAELFELHGRLKHDGAIPWHSFQPGRSSEIRLEHLESGTHRLVLLCQGGVRIHRDVEIEANRETALTVDLVTGVDVEYEIAWDFEEPPGRLRYSARTADGDIILDRTWGSLRERKEPITSQFVATVGVHTLRAWTDDGREAETTFEVRGGTLVQAPAKVALDLRRR